MLALLAIRGPLHRATRSQPGTYSVYVGGEQAGSFTVDEFADPNIILFASLAALAFVLILGAVYFTRRKQQGY